MSQINETSEPEHEVLIFHRVNEFLEGMDRTEQGYEVHANTNLTTALDKLACSPFASFISDWRDDHPILVKGENAGTWLNPDVAVFQKHATPSPFGRGDETVIDPSYRRGTELKADDLTFSRSYNKGFKYIAKKLAPVMFVCKELKIKLYKLAIYGEGGHFDWHRDSTHSDAHHGTVLIALNTEWEGGELLLRHGGVEASVDMHPVPLHGPKEDLRPVIVAFYTDTEHKVMPVTKGVRLVLQYDVEVIGEDSAAGFDHRELITAGFTTSPDLDKTLIQGVVDEIRKLHEQGTRIVAFPLTHLYRLASVKKEYLKGTDSALFDALQDHFDVSINPVVINFTYDGELGDEFGEFNGGVAYIYTTESKKDSFPDVIKGPSFHLPRASAIQLISSIPYYEHVGNESQIGEAKYYGAGMFVKPRGEL